MATRALCFMFVFFTFFYPLNIFCIQCCLEQGFICVCTCFTRFTVTFLVSSESCLIFSTAFALFLFLFCVVLPICKTLELQLSLSCIGKSSVLFHNCSVKKSVVEEAWDALRCCRSEDNCSSVRVPLLSSVVTNSIFENSPRWTEVQWATWIQNVLLICYVVWKIFIFKILGILIELFLMKSVPLVRELFPVMLSQDA